MFLNGSCEPKVIGVRNGVYQGKIKWNKFKERDSQEKIKTQFFSLDKFWANDGILRPIDFEIEYVEALKSARLTDFVQFTPHLWGASFLVTPEVKKLIEGYNLPPCQFIPASVYHRNVAYDYFAMYIPVHYDASSFDYTKSIFYEGDRHNFSQRIYHKISNINEFESYKGSLKAEKLTYNKKFDPSLDFFDTLCGGGRLLYFAGIKK